MSACKHLSVDRAELASGVVVIYCTRCDLVLGESVSSPVSARVLFGDGAAPSLFGGDQ